MQTFQKNNIEPHQSFTCCYKKHGGSRLTPIHTEYQKLKNVNKLWQKLAEQHSVKFKNYVYSKRYKRLTLYVFGLFEGKRSKR